MNGRVPRSSTRSRQDAEEAARRLYDLALTFQERSQHTEARLIEQFETVAQDLSSFVGDLMVLDDEDERLWLKRNGRFEAEVVPEREVDDGDAGEGDWRRLRRPTTWSSSTTRPTSSATWPRRSPSRSRPSSAKPATTRPRTRKNPSERRPGPEPRRSVRLLDAELLESREFLPGQWLQTYHAPWLAAGTQAGQFVHVRTPDYSGLVLRRPFSINTFDRSTGQVTIHFRVTGVGTAWLARMKPGETAEMLGPLGRGFEVDPKTRHMLLVAGGLGMAGVRSLADEALAAGRAVVMLFGAASATEVYPSSLLPDEVEYVVATDDGSFGHHGRVTELVSQFEGWADQCFACGPQPMLAALSTLAAGRRARMGVAQPRTAARSAVRRPHRSARARRAAARGCRCRWSRTWVVPSERAWDA